LDKFNVASGTVSEGRKNYLLNVSEVEHAHIHLVGIHKLPV
jgi:hypothetical protein